MAIPVLKRVVDRPYHPQRRISESVRAIFCRTWNGSADGSRAGKRGEMQPPVSPSKLVANARRIYRGNFAREDVTAVSMVPEGPERPQNFAAAPILGQAQARTGLVARERTSIRLGWAVELLGRSRGELFKVVIDAQTGEA